MYNNKEINLEFASIKLTIKPENDNQINFLNNTFIR